jgi:hypothetical protein
MKQVQHVRCTAALPAADLHVKAWAAAVMVIVCEFVRKCGKHRGRFDSGSILLHICTVPAAAAHLELHRPAAAAASRVALDPGLLWLLGTCAAALQCCRVCILWRQLAW